MQSASERIPALDGLRGLAVMGILLMNIVSFALPEGAYFNPAAGGGRSAADMAAWGLSAVLVDGRMRALFSMLFGASMLLAADRAGADASGRQRRRLAWLGLFGAAHLYLLWPGDILLHYALVGCAALAFTGRPTAGLIRATLLCFTVQLLVGGLAVANLVLLRDAASGPQAPADAVALWRGAQAAFGPADPARLAAELALHRGDWWAGVQHRLSQEAWLPLQLLLVNGPETLGLMLLGMAGLRSGFLTGGWERPRYVRAAAIAYGIGLPAAALLVAVEVRSGLDGLTVFACWLVAGLPLRPLVALGHAAVALLWLTRARRPRVEAAGRTAFTNYIASSLVMAALFEGWGLGLFGRLGRAELYLIVPPLWAAMLLWAPAWLARHRHGPLEWLWRAAAGRRKSIATLSQ